MVRLRDSLQAEKKHARTVQRAVGHLSLLFSWAIEHGHLEVANPCADVKVPAPKSKSSFYTEAEVARLLETAATHAPDLHGCIALAFYNGLRKGELAALRVGDVDLEGGRIVVSRSWKNDARKSGEAVTVHLHPHMEAILRPLVEGRGADDLVFPDPTTGRMRPDHDAHKGCWGLRELAELAQVRRFDHPFDSFGHAHQ